MRELKYIKDISEFIFVQDELRKADIIFIVGGNYPEPAEKAAYLIKKGYSGLVLASGKYSPKIGYFPGSATKRDVYDGNYKTESEFMIDVLMKNGVDENKIICEDKSEYTFENAIKAREVTIDMDINRAILCCQAFHSRRVLMYYQMAFPETTFFVIPSETQNISKDNWYRTENGVEIVLDELQRCGEQFKDLFKNNIKMEDVKNGN